MAENFYNIEHTFLVCLSFNTSADKNTVKSGIVDFTET